MYIKKLIKIVPTLSLNSAGLYNQITHLTIYCISSRLVTILKVTVIPMQVSDIFYFTVSFKYINFCLEIFLLFCPDNFLPHVLY